MAKTLTIPQKETLRNRLSELYMQGYSFNRMSRTMAAEGLPVAVSTVSIHMKSILKEMYEKRERNVEIRINAELQKINELEYEAWQAWKRSCKSKIKKSSKRKGMPSVRNKDGKDVEFIKALYVEETEHTEDMVGDPRFMDIIKDCIQTRLAWIAKETETEKPGTVNNITNNTTLIMASQAKYVPAKLQQMQAQLVTKDIDTIN